MPEKIVDVGPVAAGNAVAVVTDSFHTIDAFSKTTGKSLWEKKTWSSVLASDGNYFYIIRTGYWDIEALNPASGDVVWSVQIPPRLRRGNHQFQGMGKQNARYFSHRSDQGAQNARTAAANIAKNGPTNHATAFIVTDGSEPTKQEERNLGNVHRVGRVGNVFLYEPGPAPPPASPHLVKTPPSQPSRSQPKDEAGGYPSLLVVRRGFLFTVEVVVDLSKRAVVHTWTPGPYVTSIAINDHDEIVVGDSSGAITTYDKTFKPLRKTSVNGRTVVQAEPAQDGILAAAYSATDESHDGMISLLTQAGAERWRFLWSSDMLLAQPPFVLAGSDVLTIEPGATRHELRLASRNLSTGQVNWTTSDGFFYGPVVLCDDTVYVRERDTIRSFDVQTGTETTARN